MATATLDAPFALEAATATATSVPLLPPLPFTLDLSCPLPLPQPRVSRPAFASEWPFPVAGPSTGSGELPAFVERRYLETVYFGETLFPLAGLVDDLARAAAAHPVVLPAPLGLRLLPLPAIEARHRRALRPAVVAAAAAVEGGDEAMPAVEGVLPIEVNMLAAAVGVRLRSRAVADGRRVITARNLVEEFERREVLVQLVLLLFYRGMSPNPSDGDEGKEGYKKKEKSKKRRRSAAPSVLDDTDTALEVLADRISLWLAVAELGIGDDTPQLQPIPQAQPQKGDERSAPSLVRALWDRVLVPKFLPRETAFLSTFHSKVFGAPIPPDLVPAKKPRKPKVTHRLDPSTSTSASAAAAGAAHKMARTRSAASPPADARERDRRQLAEYVERRALARSRSASIGPARETAASGSRRAVVRAPSGKDMFKGREVGLLRRSASLVGRSAGSQPALRRYESQSQLHSQSQSQSQSQLPQSQSQSIPMDSQTQPLSRAAHSETLIMATPAKTKYTTGGSYGGGVRLFGFAAPTPIREEPSSAERPHSASTHRSFVTDTPVAHRTYSPAFVAETPRAPRLGLGDRAEDSDEDFGGLMVPTDDEDEGEDGSSMTFVPETPRK